MNKEEKAMEKMSTKTDLIEQKFGRWTALRELSADKHGQSKWLCKCECGTKREVGRGSLRSGKSKSCGCLRKELTSKRMTTPKPNLTGKRVGRYLIVEKTGNGKVVGWLCKCDCGTEKVMAERYLVRSINANKNISCGCYLRETFSSRKIIDLTGQRFDRWLVLKKTEERAEDNRLLWFCQCDCGTKKTVDGGSLRAGKTRSCGCLTKEVNSKRFGLNLIGQKFNRLKVLELVKTDRNTFWRVKCDCGNKKTVRGPHLKSGRIKSCGCLRNELASKRMTTHGISGTKEFWGYHNKKRRDRKNLLLEDKSWTYEMEKSCNDFFPCCIVCGETENLTTDHVYPLSKGFPLEPGNAVRLCKKHNSWKYDRWLCELGKNYITLFKLAANSFAIHWEKYSILSKEVKQK